jgi:hypothetical protein
LINKLGSKLVELEGKLEEWDKKEQIKYKKGMENWLDNKEERSRMKAKWNQAKYKNMYKSRK